jgi:ketosteroid isomerase-like protein
MKKSILLLLLVSAFVNAQVSQKEQVSQTLDAWHKAAADANFEVYFNLIADDGVFIGTDATENWIKPDFKVWAKPFFDKGQTWSFTALERHIFFDKTGKIAWFDELLNTQMKICRGSGVLVKIGKEWKIQHYVLSMTIPNDEVDAAIKIKHPSKISLLPNFKKKINKF